MSYPDLSQKVEALAVDRIDRVLMIEEREKHPQAFKYKSTSYKPNTENYRPTTIYRVSFYLYLLVSQFDCS